MKHVLIVDDNAVNLMTAQTALGKQYKTTVLTSGIQLIKWLGTHKTDLILLDIEMPVLNGYATLKEIRKTEENKNIPVVFLTSVTDRDKVIYGIMQEGVKDYISKPIDKEYLLKQVESLIGTGAEVEATEEEATEENNN